LENANRTDDLTDFADQVTQIIAAGGGAARGSQLLDGVFFSETQNTTTFERSRAFDLDGVEPDELHAIADTIRARFAQESVLTFDRLSAGDPEADAVELDVPGVTKLQLRDGLLEDAEARRLLIGGSVTLNNHLKLVASREDADFATQFAERIGGDVRRVTRRYGEREFVDGPAPVRVENRTLHITGASTIDARGGRLDVTAGGETFPIARARFDRYSWKPGDGHDDVDGGDGRDSLMLTGSSAAEAFRLTRDGGGVRLTHDADVLELDHLEEADAVAGGGADTFAVGDLRRTDAQLVDISLASLPITAGGDTAADRVTVDGTSGRDALELTGKVVVGGTATLSGLAATVSISHAEPADTLVIDTRAGKDKLDTSAFDPRTIGLQVLE
jgi:hypothetical protein